jgi:predicted nucleic acid-binding protein
VILVDANILVYAHVISAAQHEHARGWRDQQLNGATPVGLPSPSLPAFLRLVTNPRVSERPEPITDACRQVLAWLDCETVRIPQPAERHAELLGQLLAMARDPRESRPGCPPGRIGDGARIGAVRQLGHGGDARVYPSEDDARRKWSMS